MDIRKNSALIKAEATRLGFAFCGFSKAGFLEEEATRLERWLSGGNHGAMAYMANHFDKRLDPRKLVPGARSVVSLLLNYYPAEKQEDPRAPNISKYAYGKTDYHLVVKDKLRELMHFIFDEIGDVGGRVFVDSAPVLERAWAAKSGLGWVGKNTNLIHPRSGSYYFIAELILDLELEPDGPMRDYCGTCTACIDACPTEAITPYHVDGSKCISYFTIELKGEIPQAYKGKFENWAFGCDICQEVCPWNRFSKPHTHPGLEANDEMLGWSETRWTEMTESVFKKVFGNSAVNRAGYKGMQRNLAFLKEDMPPG